MVLCWPKNIVRGCVINKATHATFDHVFWPAENTRATRTSTRCASAYACVWGAEGRGEKPFATVTFHSYFDSIERVSTTDAWGE